MRPDRFDVDVPQTGTCQSCLGWKPGDNTQKFKASYKGLPLDLTVCPDEGNSCVNAFVLDTTEARHICKPIFSPSLRVGLEANFSDATGGPDRLFLSNAVAVSEPGPRSVPAPLMAMGSSPFWQSVVYCLAASCWKV